jgi:molybdopterin-guanine dinucleotide biosynthesis protein A
VKVVCVILAGGEGQRMGGAKPLQPFGEGTLISHALALARGYAGEVAVAVRDPSQLSGLDAPLIVDDPAIEGPLAGLAAALAEATMRGADALLTLPCDAPRLPPDLATRLVAGLECAPAAVVAMAASGGRRHPVCALWRVSALDALAGYLASGARSLWRFGETCGVEDVEWPAEPDDPFANANTPDELAALQPPRGEAP